MRTEVTAKRGGNGNRKCNGKGNGNRKGKGEVNVKAAENGKKGNRNGNHKKVAVTETVPVYQSRLFAGQVKPYGSGLDLTRPDPRDFAKTS